eukprot:TRINITY_DN2254_c0_g1_i1.p1 TRINITY_DN2254_c0_g1~~TRINITY_DN2254_c0_g1_i1.p1  ORF type:complete len:602 (+),score=185.20 TRINITY_DN2254_c0_g1_i1:84-1889(+)
MNNTQNREKLLIQRKIKQLLTFDFSSPLFLEQIHISKNIPDEYLEQPREQLTNGIYDTQKKKILKAKNNLLQLKQQSVNIYDNLEKMQKNCKSVQNILEKQKTANQEFQKLHDELYLELNEKKYYEQMYVKILTELKLTEKEKEIIDNKEISERLFEIISKINKIKKILNRLSEESQFINLYEELNSSNEIYFTKALIHLERGLIDLIPDQERQLFDLVKYFSVLDGDDSERIIYRVVQAKIDNLITQLILPETKDPIELITFLTQKITSIFEISKNFAKIFDIEEILNKLLLQKIFEPLTKHLIFIYKIFDFTNSNYTYEVCYENISKTLKILELLTYLIRYIPEEMLDEIFSMFKSSLLTYLEKVQIAWTSHVTSAPPTLLPSEQFLATFELLQNVFSLSFSQPFFQEILTVLIHINIAVIQATASELKGISNLIFQLNCLDYLSCFVILIPDLNFETNQLIKQIIDTYLRQTSNFIMVDQLRRLRFNRDESPSKNLDCLAKNLNIALNLNRIQAETFKNQIVEQIKQLFIGCYDVEFNKFVQKLKDDYIDQELSSRGDSMAIRMELQHKAAEMFDLTKILELNILQPQQYNNQLKITF